MPDVLIVSSRAQPSAQADVDLDSDSLPFRSCKALGSIVSLRHLIAEDCTQLSSRGIAALTGLTVSGPSFNCCRDPVHSAYCRTVSVAASVSAPP